MTSNGLRQVDRFELENKSNANSELLKLISFEFHLTQDRFSVEEFLFKILPNDE